MKTPSKLAITITKDLITLTALIETLEEKHEILYKNFLKKNKYIDEEELNKNGLLEINKNLTKVNEVKNLKMEKEDEAIEFLLHKLGVSTLTKIQKKRFIYSLIFLPMKTTLEFLNSLNLDIDFEEIVKINEISSFEELEEVLQEYQMLDVEIIYNFNAMKFLSENDQSLQESIEIAVEYGYELADITSELLASLLASKELKEEFSNNQDAIEEYFDNLDS